MEDPRYLMSMFLPHFFLVYKGWEINFELKDYTYIPLWYDLDVNIKPPVEERLKQIINNISIKSNV